MVSRPRTPLALAVLSALLDRPRHPYEIASWLRATHKHESIKINFGSLYSVVDRLAADGLIAARDTERAGNRPERTVYEITAAGRWELSQRLAELLAEPVREYPSFEGALALMLSIPPEEVAAHLRVRAATLDRHLADGAAQHEVVVEAGLPGIFLIEWDLQLALVTAERDFVVRLADQIERGELDGLAIWQRIADPDQPSPDPEEFDVSPTGKKEP